MSHPDTDAFALRCKFESDGGESPGSTGQLVDETFRFAPIPILVEDWSGIRQWVDDRKAEGVTDLDAYLDEHPTAIQQLRDRHHHFVDANDAALKLFDATSRETFFAAAKALLPASRPSNSKVLKAIFDGETACQGERTLTSLTGGKIPIVWRCSLPADPARYARLHFYAFDISEYQENINRLQVMRADVARAGRIALVGQLAASITHEISQPLSATRTSIEAAARWLDREGPDVMEAMASVRDAGRWARDATDICHRLRGFMMHTPVQARLQSAADVVASAIYLISPEAAARAIDVETSVDAGLRVFVDRVQLQQVLGNLLLNGIHAIDATSDARARKLTVGVEPEGDVSLLFKVTDTGHGIDATSLETLFQPFSTSKAEGMGVGLSISRSIIEAHGGRIWAESADGMGATFCFTLPGAKTFAG
ncbi:MAG: GHKL domain-containing protein [Cupriavidus sp.]|uniref:sensor histidine kinase n=1 Tax=Cupriavidus sp. TaxID=1873897 RepID=UPI0025BFA49F|nr:ATP-binding protein [Cupriavidus sp.]MCA3184694.1 GHKL domain-containing protein [Cupriavidus sp.]MCA3194256.1 GHKL domain-containing protein [Cupriavidus sp.]MCA3194792.1 GHKL domain-containing protein [Cupriavidus sp.]MCA3230827.1 GHKL domain-containing protein [Cupriavidus sp.]